uniref:Uncharacterized protein n=1 Tax=Physcomitrium patens TaxID=3218 RepID=A0A2K1KEA7_PHYPA|nr:hypothetical protein PHYPA_008484 [Physcomitrium patens]
MNLCYHWSLDFVGTLVVIPPRFGIPIEISIIQRREFFRSFEALCTKALINHHIMSKNHLKIDSLVEQVN